jgi:alkylation response protein AidB-like acyl-CoA dehydrogenase
VLHDGLALAGAARAERFVSVSADGVVAVSASAVTLAAIRGLDPALGLSRATVDTSAAEVVGGPGDATAALAAGRRALASQMVGASDQMLTDTLAYVLERHQYGRAIGSFQTVKHRLADVKVAFTAARSATRAAWEAADTGDGPLTAMAAKVLAGRAQQLASTHCYQVHGGIAFTVEHGFQQWVRRGLVLDHLLGGHEQLAREVGARLIEGGRVPRVPQLY